MSTAVSGWDAVQQMRADPEQNMSFNERRYRVLNIELEHCERGEGAWKPSEILVSSMVAARWEPVVERKTA
jgi:hypothetical protein